MASPERKPRPAYVEAFTELAARIVASLAGVAPAALPIRMVVAGGAALHFHTGSRVSLDIDASFSRRIVLPAGLEVAYRDEDGAARLLYFNYQYNDTLGLMHEDAYADSLPLSLPGIDSRVLDVRLLAPVDLAISKLGRYSAQDIADILALATHGLLDGDAMVTRAQAAISAYVGDTRRLQGNIDDIARKLKRLCGPEAGDAPQ